MAQKQEPEKKKWYTFVADGQVVGTMPDCAATRKEVKRLQRLGGIEVREATDKEIDKVMT